MLMIDLLVRIVGSNNQTHECAMAAALVKRDSLANLQGTALQPEYLPIRPRHSDEGRGQHLERS